MVRVLWRRWQFTLHIVSCWRRRCYRLECAWLSRRPRLLLLLPVRQRGRAASRVLRQQRPVRSRRRRSSFRSPVQRASQRLLLMLPTLRRIRRLPAQVLRLRLRLRLSIRFLQRLRRSCREMTPAAVRVLAPAEGMTLLPMRRTILPRCLRAIRLKEPLFTGSCPRYSGCRPTMSV